MEELTEQQLSKVSGGNWQPNKCKGYVTGTTTYKGYSCNVYVTAFGDTLSQIAWSLSNGDYNKLARFNDIPNPDNIDINQTIFVPTGPYSA